MANETQLKVLGKPTKAKPAPEPIDPSQPLKIEREERYALTLVAGITQAEAYRSIYPCSKKWKDSTIYPKASRLASKIRARIQWLQKQAASERVSDAQERAEYLTRIHRDRLSKFITCGADGVIVNIGPDEANSPALESVKSRTITIGQGDGAMDAIVTEVKLKDGIAAVKELNRMQGSYKEPVQEHHVTGEVTLAMLLDRVAKTPRGLPTDKMIAGKSIPVIDIKEDE